MPRTRGLGADRDNVTLAERESRYQRDRAVATSLTLRRLVPAIADLAVHAHGPTQRDLAAASERDGRDGWRARARGGDGISLSANNE